MIFSNVYVCVSMCGCTHMSAGDCWCQRCQMPWSYRIWIHVPSKISKCSWLLVISSESITLFFVPFFFSWGTGTQRKSPVTPDPQLEKSHGRAEAATNAMRSFSVFPSLLLPLPLNFKPAIPFYYEGGLGFLRCVPFSVPEFRVQCLSCFLH